MVGLPAFAQSRLNRTEVVTFARLMSELTQIEDGSNRQKTKARSFFSVNSSNSSLPLDKPGSQEKRRFKDRKPCLICEKRGRLGLMHLEDKCHFRERKHQDTSGNVKLANNTQLEGLFNADEDLTN